MVRRGVWIVVTVFLVLVGCLPAFAQRADVSGVVVDQTGGVLPGVAVTIVKSDQGLKRETVTDGSGHFSMALLQPGKYVLSAQIDGFAPFEMKDLVLNIGDALALSIKMQVAGLGEAVTVKGEASKSAISATVGTVIDRQFVENIPLNGGTLQSLLAITPGVVMAAGDGQMSINGLRTDSNYLTVDGVSANIGVTRGSGTVAVALGSTALPGTPEVNAAGATPGFSAVGTTNNLFSIEELQEFKTETSNSSAAFGRQAGGQIGITTRSGSNQLHGSVYEYYRSDKFDGADWFTTASATPIPKQKLSQNQFGATFGGPIVKNRMFFFANYEGLRLTLPQTATLRVVPSSAMRSLAGLDPTVKKLINAYPLPTDETSGCTLRTVAISTATWSALPSASQGGAVYSPSIPEGTVVGACYTDAPSSRTTMNAFRVKFDYQLNANHSIWARVNTAPVSSQTFTLANRQFSDGDTYTVTTGYKAVLSARMLNDLTVNWSKNLADMQRDLIVLNGATPYASSLLLPSFAPTKSIIVQSLPSAMANTSPQLGPSLGNVQEQWNITDNFRYVRGRHTFGAGFDVRRLMPVYSKQEYQVTYGFSTSQSTPTIRTALDLFTASSPLIGSLSTFAYDTVAMQTTNFSAYVQDHWTVSRRLTLDLGVRWDVNTPPTGTNVPLYTLSGFPDFSALKLTTEPFFKTKYNAFAPRIGAAYQLSGAPGREMVLRGGYGLYSDLGMGAVSAAGYQFPYSRSLAAALRSVPFPASEANLAAPAALSLDPPYTGQSFSLMGPGYMLPRVQQWNITLERTFWSNNIVSVAYVGSAGRHLLRRYYYGTSATYPATANNPLPGNPNFLNARLNVTRNDGAYGDVSDYKALQISYFRRLSHGLQALANYTWSKAEDTGSSSVNSAVGTTSASTENFGQSTAPTAADTKGYSDFDRRHLFNAAVTYELPNLKSRNKTLDLIEAIVVRGWATDLIFKYQSAAPLTPFYSYIDSVSGVGFFYRADQVAGQDVWLTDPTLPGGKRLNPAAFAVPSGVGAGLSTSRNGNIVRNSIRGFDLYQLDFSLRRTIAVTRGLKAQFKVEVFNVTNHPNFSPSNTLVATVQGATGAITSSSSFGRTTSMFAKAPSPGATGGTLNSLYAIGGPRSMQFTVKLLF
jgi:hypothetical protein